MSVQRGSRRLDTSFRRADGAPERMQTMRRHRRAIEDLRLAVECLPEHTRAAMLEGIRSNDRIIVGAYTDHRGGVCPMLAAHRCGGRTDFISFARAWDRFTHATKRSRRATERELGVLVAFLESTGPAELTRDELDLRRAIADHKALKARHAADDAPRPGDPDRHAELRKRSGWAWLRPFRRLDDYERALARLEERREALDDDRELEHV